MSLALLMGVLTREHGLRFDALAEDRLRRALADDGPDADAAARHAIAHPGSRQGLVDAVTLQETSFFRDPAVWESLAAEVLPAVLSAAQGAPVVVWSAGCANGQEAWGLAMLLLELGAVGFEVVASDLSATAVARAAAGSYHERELRGLGRARRARFLEPHGDRWRVVPELRRHVRVVHQNVATDTLPVAAGSCSLVLCRYVMIYLTPGAAHEVLEHIERALVPEGRLVIGAAESLWHLTERFAPVGPQHAVAYGRREAGGSARVPFAAQRGAAPVAPPRDTGAGSTRPAVGDAAGLVATGEAAAARGDLTAAAAAFRGVAYLDPDDAVALARLGLVLEAMGDPGAPRAFRSASAALGRRGARGLDAALGGYAATALEELVASKLGRTG